ncbi:MAG: hypothetical protein ABI461_21075, partial [Polyangiaceae bacterium]
LSLITLAFAGACGDSTLIVGEDDLEEPFPDIDGSFEDATDETRADDCSQERGHDETMAAPLCEFHRRIGRQIRVRSRR